MILPINSSKAININSKKTFNKLRKEDNFLHMIKILFQNPKGNIITTGKDLEEFPLK